MDLAWAVAPLQVPATRDVAGAGLAAGVAAAACPASVAGTLSEAGCVVELDDATAELALLAVS